MLAVAIIIYSNFVTFVLKAAVEYLRTRCVNPVLSWSTCVKQALRSTGISRYSTTQRQVRLRIRMLGWVTQLFTLSFSALESIGAFDWFDFCNYWCPAVTWLPGYWVSVFLLCTDPLRHWLLSPCELSGQQWCFTTHCSAVRTIPTSA